MIEIIGKTVDLRTMTRREMHALYRKYIPDPLMDPNPFVYDGKKVDALFDRDEARESWYPVVGIFTKQSEIIGSLSFKRIVFSEARCELGILLANDSYKDRGYGTEALESALKYARDTLHLTRVYADTAGRNLRMRHILGKLGFNNIRVHENYYDMNGVPDDRLDYMISL